MQSSKAKFASVLMMVVGLTVLTILTQAVTVSAQATKIKVGKVIGGDGFHLPSYVAMERGMFKGEGLDVSFITTGGAVLVRAAIAKEIDFAPIPGGGSEAMLKGAPLVFVVGESLVSQWTLTTGADIKRVEDLKGKTLGLGRPGGADYTELVVVLGKFFKMESGKDYKVISFTAEPDRVAALVNRSIQGASLSFVHAARAEKEGMKILLRTGDYIPRLGGTLLTHKDFVKEKPDATKRFIKAIARAADYIRTNQQGTVEVIQKHIEIGDPKVIEGFYKQVSDKYGPEIPTDLLRLLFESRARPELGWPAGKPIPDPEQFVARDLLNEVLKEMGRKVTK
ncbi:MAG: ABC transporter substrate-binding protein [Candidatus Binatia bacterium]